MSNKSSLDKSLYGAIYKACKAAIEALGNDIDKMSCISIKKK